MNDPRNNLGKDARHSCFSLSNLYPCSTRKPPKHLEIACRCQASTMGITPRLNPQGRKPTFANPPQISCVRRDVAELVLHADPQVKRSATAALMLTWASKLLSANPSELELWEPQLVPL